ncbi:MAG: methylation-associated defense system protein MAD4 [Phycisphaerae bacterium]
MDGYAKDLFVLVPGKDERACLAAILSRWQSLGIRPITWDIEQHEQRDGGCYRVAHEYLRTAMHQYAHALLVFDREGCGNEQRARDELEREVEVRLSSSGWDDRAAVVVIDPELEMWVWSDSPHVGDVLGWKDQATGLRDWLTEQGFLRTGQIKPDRPKEAVERVFRRLHRPRSSRIYAELAQRVSLERCTDPAFLKLRRVLARWFPPSDPA